VPGHAEAQKEGAAAATADGHGQYNLLPVYAEIGTGARCKRIFDDLASGA